MIFYVIVNHFTRESNGCGLTIGNIVSIFAAIAALVSLGLAIYIGLKHPKEKRSRHCNWIAYGLIAFWVLIPPVYFWLDWLYMTAPADREMTVHTHDLARNIWLALVVVLAGILEIKWPKG
jgi:hypothetical protein